MHRQRGPAALASDLGDRAAEVHVDVVHADLVDQVPHRLTQGVGVRAVQLHALRGLGAVEPQHGEGAGVALHEGSGRDHLRHVQAGPEA